MEDSPALYGDYRVVRVLGRGGMGVVYEAEQGALGRRVALKVLSAEAAADPVALARLRREALAMGALQHPHVVQVSDFSEGPPPFLVMEVLSGQSLRERLQQRGSIPYGDACLVALQLLAALSAAHRAGIIHRDVKPANVFVVQTPVTDLFVKLLDFGVAKLLVAQGPVLTHVDAIIGSAPYMAPEQIRGEAVDAKTDVFALGVTLYEMLAGRRPFVGGPGESVMIAILRGGPIASLAGVPRELEAVVLRALQRSPSARYLTADDMMAAVMPFVSQASLSVLATTAMASRGPASQTSRDPPGVPWSTQAQAGPSSVAWWTQHGPAGPASTTQQFGTQHTAPHVSLTIDGTVAMPPRVSQQGGPAHRARRSVVFVTAMVAPVLIAAAVGAGLFVAHTLAKTEVSNPSVVPPALDAASSPTAQAPAASGSPKATGPTRSGPRVAGPAPSATPRAVAQTSRSAAEVDGTAGAPVPGGCRCDGIRGGPAGTAALCHPLTTTAPKCTCRASDNGATCWQPFKRKSSCPEPRRTLAATARPGQSCTAFKIDVLSGGLNDTAAETATNGTIDGCSRCGETRVYPRTPGAACVGVDGDTGQRVEGRVFCP